MKDIFYLLFLPLRTEVVLRFFYHTEYFFSGFLGRSVLCFTLGILSFLCI